MAIKCFLCGDMVERDFATRTSKSRIHNAIILSTLSIYSSIKPEVAKSCFPIMNTRKYICLIHCTDAAQYLLAEVLRSGGALSETLERIPYMNQNDVFEHIPALLNDAIGLFADDVIVSSYDVTRYLNDYLKRFYVHGRWCTSPATGLMEDSLEPFTQQTTSNNSLAESHDCQTGAPPVKKRNLGSPVRFCTSPAENKSESSTETTFKDGSFFSLDELQADCEVPELEETDPALLDKDFVIKGRKLLELFNLNRCGCSDDHEAGVGRDPSSNSGKDKKTRNPLWRRSYAMGNIGSYDYCIE
ncbi:unnamed protein product [Cylicocyclus nassatus]|uniref:Uncharacterized protein n=1 Tax=Cylicocyclus nassatus TaxID=53992 RepID=A0AA36M5T3_CYLNA|nr:unnamed protein product [Cylicocyclus nassatus]